MYAICKHDYQVRVTNRTHFDVQLISIVSILIDASININYQFPLEGLYCSALTIGLQTVQWKANDTFSSISALKVSISATPIEET